MKRILKAELITISVYILAYIVAETILYDVGHYWSVITWSVLLIGWITFVMSLGKPEAGVICALMYPVIVVFSHSVTKGHNTEGGICLWGSIIMIVIITTTMHKLQKRKQQS